MPDSRFLLEIAANSLDSAHAAQAGGADRIELCSALELGGLTPSAGLVEQVQAQITLPVMVLIRPRAGDFVYSAAEHATMLADIAWCRRARVAGVVLGALTADAEVDVARCRELVDAAGDLDVVFNRAIDVSCDLSRSLEAVINLGCMRVLSSGGATSAMHGAARLRGLVDQARGRIVIMPGAGIDANTVAALRSVTGAHEFHASAKRVLPTRTRQAAAAALGMEAGEWRSDAEQVSQLVQALRGS